MTAYKDMTLDQRRAEYAALQTAFADLKAQGLKLDMTRGKPCKDQLDMVSDIFDMLKEPEDYIVDGIDIRNYGALSGLPEAKRLFANLLDCKPKQVFVGGNASLQLMYGVIDCAFIHGRLNSPRPWCKEPVVKWLCPAPGYDRHFKLTESFGFELITIPMTSTGPDMDAVEEAIKDPAVKGIWCVPKYSNPTGITFSEDTVRRLVEMPTAAPDFRIFWDNAYCVHDLYDETDELANIFDLARAAGTEDRVVAFASTSKITVPGAGIGFIGASPAVIAEFSKRLKAGLISADKLSQLRHVRFLPTLEAVKEHMKKHAEFLRPRFEAVERKLTEGLGDTGCATWTHPRGGYFVSFDGPEGSAQKVAALCADLGVKLTPAGATWPYGKDPRDTNIRIAPSYPTVEDLEAALDVLVLAVKLVAAELARAERG